MADRYAKFGPFDADFKERLGWLDIHLKRRGIWADPTSGYRSPRMQAALYAKGRTKPGPKATNARPGDSAHCPSPNPKVPAFAADFVPVVNGKRTYKVSKLWWAKFGVAVWAAGLAWGGSWRKFLDRPHVELRNWEKKRNTYLK